MILRFAMTCKMYPEQYDVFDPTGNPVGYLRLRHGHFTVRYPDYMGSLIFEAEPEGDGCFEDHERCEYLRIAAEKILEKINFGF